MKDAMLQILMSFLGSLGFSVLFHVRGSKLFLAALGGALSWGLNLLLELWVPSEPLRYFFSSSFVAVYAEILARALKTPATTFLIPSIIPHIPGGALYHTMRYGLNRQWSACLSKAFYTLKLALALALGIIAVLSVLGVVQQLLNRLWYSQLNGKKERHL